MLEIRHRRQGGIKYGLIRQRLGAEALKALLNVLSGLAGLVHNLGQLSLGRTGSFPKGIGAKLRLTGHQLLVVVGTELNARLFARRYGAGIIDIRPDFLFAAFFDFLNDNDDVPGRVSDRRIVIGGRTAGSWARG